MKNKNKQEEQQVPNNEAQEEPQVNKEAELKDLLLRTQANFENYRKQTEKRIEDIRQMASRNILLEIIPVIDNFNLALQSADTNSNHEDFLKGVELIYAQLFEVLNNNGVSTIETKDQIFNPHFHEALMKANSDKPENTIVEEFSKGFMLSGKVIRHAKVKVSSGKKE
jgi:molecular chaperone GrpE